MDALFHDPAFWVAVGFVIFVALVWKPAARAVSESLDARALRIRSQIEEAEALRNEAQALLESYKRKHRESVAEAQAIIARARDEAVNIAREASAALDAALKRREQQTLEKIAQAEATALRDVRNQAVEVAIAAARRIVAEGMKGERGEKLVEAAIKELPGKLH